MGVFLADSITLVENWKHRFGLTTKLENNNTMIGYKYLSSKDKLPDVYTSPRVRDKILAVIPKIKFT